jgi:hypothetical protein
MAPGSGRSNARLQSGKQRQGRLGLRDGEAEIEHLEAFPSSGSREFCSLCLKPSGLVGSSDPAEKVGERRPSARNAGRIAVIVLQVGFHAISLCNSCG